MAILLVKVLLSPYLVQEDSAERLFAALHKERVTGQTSLRIAGVNNSQKVVAGMICKNAMSTSIKKH